METTAVNSDGGEVGQTPDVKFCTNW